MKRHFFPLLAIGVIGFFAMGQSPSPTGAGGGCANSGNGGIAGTGLHGELDAGTTVDPNDPSNLNVNIGGKVYFAKRPLTSVEKTEIHNQAFAAGAAWWTKTGGVGDDRPEQRKLVNRLRYHYRVHWAVIHPLAASAWEEGCRSAGKPPQT